MSPPDLHVDRRDVRLTAETPPRVRLPCAYSKTNGPTNL